MFLSEADYLDEYEDVIIKKSAMFRKNNFVVKSSTNIRHSERKALFTDDINSCFNSKQQFLLLKVAFPNGSIQRIFLHEGEPLYFQNNEGDDSTIYPSVYFLWMFPDAPFQLPVLHVHSSTFGSLKNGSDLMVPGIYPTLPDFQANSPVAIATVNEDENGELMYFGPIAVGRALFSSVEIKERLNTGKKGKAVEILHIFGDHLWAYGSKKEFPRIHTGQTMSGMEEGGGGEEGWADDGQNGGTDTGGQQQGEAASDERRPTTADHPEEMNKLLRATFFSALRWKFADQQQTIKYPIDVGQFYANYILKCLPPGCRLEIKKTRYKKFSTFLREINTDNEQREWVVSVKTDKRGVDSIDNINFDHKCVKNAQLLEQDSGGAGTWTTGMGPSTSGSGSHHQPMSTAASSSTAATTTFLRVREQMFSLTEQVMPLFRPVGLHKGDLVDAGHIRVHLVEYGQKQNLLRDGGKTIQLDDQLQMLVKHFLPDTFPVNTVAQKLASAMTAALLVQTRDGQQLVHRGKVPCIEIKVQKRMGNKIVTLVNNLALFGIDAKMVDKEIKGTGTTIIAGVAGCEGPQLLIQGNEVNSVGRILEGLGLPKKFMRGLELGIKERKKKAK